MIAREKEKRSIPQDKVNSSVSSSHSHLNYWQLVFSFSFFFILLMHHSNGKRIRMQECFFFLVNRPCFILSHREEDPMRIRLLAFSPCTFNELINVRFYACARKKMSRIRRHPKRFSIFFLYFSSSYFMKERRKRRENLTKIETKHGTATATMSKRCFNMPMNNRSLFDINNHNKTVSITSPPPPPPPPSSLT